MANHPNRKPVSHDDMIENHTSFYPATRSFQSNALRQHGQVIIAGSINVVPLWVCVEWDAKKVLLGYHWQPPIGGARDNAGYESWFRADWLIVQELGTRSQREEYNYMREQPLDLTQQDHDFILKLARECQETLDADDLDSDSKERTIRQRISIESNAPPN